MKAVLLQALLLNFCLCKDTISVFDFIKNGVNDNKLNSEKDYTPEIEETFRNYIEALNDKSVRDMSIYFNFDRYIWNSGPVFHFGDNAPFVFETPEELDSFFSDWKYSPKNYNNTTQIDTIYITPISGGIHMFRWN